MSSVCGGLSTPESRDAENSAPCRGDQNLADFAHAANRSPVGPVHPKKSVRSADTDAANPAAIRWMGECWGCLAQPEDEWAVYKMLEALTDKPLPWGNVKWHHLGIDMVAASANSRG